MRCTLPFALLACLAAACSSSSREAPSFGPPADASVEASPGDGGLPDQSTPEDSGPEADGPSPESEAEAEATPPDGAAPDAPDSSDSATAWPDEHCLEVIPGHNEDDPSRFNLVLLYAGFDGPSSPMDVPHLLESMVAGTTDNDYSFDPDLAPLYAVEGLAGIQPFQSNLDRFNFWYVDLPLYGAGDICPFLQLEPETTCAGNVLTTLDKDGNPVQTVLSPQDILPLSAAGQSCALPNKIVNLLYAPTDVMSEQTFPAPGNYAVFGSYAQEVLMFGATTSASMVFANVVHELVHAIGLVWDEKGNNLSPDDYPASVPGPNCFSLGPSEPLTPASCASNPNLPWHDLIGNGCGADGVVDCPVTHGYFDPNTQQHMVTRLDEWLYELRDDVDGCGQGCLYTQGNVFRPFQGCNVMSSCDLTPEIRTGLMTRLGPVNEREVCRRILAVTGSVSAWCEALCLAGCPWGQRCVQGSCVDQADIP